MAATTDRSIAERRLIAMGTRVHVIVLGGGPALLDELTARIAELESKWSRFLPGSEISTLNRTPGRWHVVSDDTALLVARAVEGWQRTSGGFDPTVLGAVEAAGYDRSFRAMKPGADLIPGGVATAPGCGGIEIDCHTGLVRFPPGIGFDPGGIGKGLAADLVVDLAMVSGAEGAMVNLGGDLACRGNGPDGTWCVELTEPFVRPEPVGRVRLRDGALVTSTTRRRRWATADGERHHVIDPHTGASTNRALLATVVAAEGWWAEVNATALLVGGIDTPIDDSTVAALVVDDAGVVHHLGDMDRFLP